jgi:hypothetical protein
LATRHYASVVGELLNAVAVLDSEKLEKLIRLEEDAHAKCEQIRLKLITSRSAQEEILCGLILATIGYFTSKGFLVLAVNWKKRRPTCQTKVGRRPGNKKGESAQLLWRKPQPLRTGKKSPLSPMNSGKLEAVQMDHPTRIGFVLNGRSQTVILQNSR